MNSSTNNPQVVRTDIDHSLFAKKLKCSYLDIPNSRIREIQRKLHEHMVTLPKFKPLIPIIGCNDKKRLILKHYDESQATLSS